MDGWVTLCFVTGCPFILGVITTLVVAARVGSLGWWGLLPFGGTIKRLLEDRL